MDEALPSGTAADHRAGARFGPYLLKRRLGRGGFGEVYEAFDTSKHRTVALKLLPPSYSADPNFRVRLFREAITAGSLNEPHVVPIHNYGEIDGQLFIDMRLISGTDLRNVLNENGPLHPARAVGIVAQIASALDAAHAEQIVHRDVKPANILLTPQDFACLVDFGLANASTHGKLTSAGNTIGTFAYMAPERFNGQQIDHRADIYSLACVLYECLTGTAPYRAADQAALIAAHLANPIPRPSQQRPDIPAWFDEIIARGMAKDRTNRYTTAGELAAAARHGLANTPPHDPAPASTPNTTAAQPVSTVTPATALPPRTSRRPKAGILAAAVVFVLIAATALTHWVGNQRKSVAPAPSTTFARISAAIPVGKHPEGVALDPALHSAYTANYGNNTVSVIDTTTHTVTATIPVGRGPLGVAVNPTTHTIYTANNRDDSVSVIDPITQTVIATIDAGTNPWGVAVDPAAHIAYAANNWDNTVSVISLDNHSVIATAQVGKHPEWVAVDPATHTAYVTNNSDGTVSIIDAANHAITTSTISVGNGPLGVAVNPATHRAYTANYGDNTVSVIDTTNHTVIATIKAGTNPWGITIDPTTHTAYVTNSTDGTVSIIDTATHTVTTTVNVANRLWGIVIDPTTHTAYTANANDTVSVIEPAR